MQADRQAGSWATTAAGLSSRHSRMVGSSPSVQRTSVCRIGSRLPLDLPTPAGRESRALTTPGRGGIEAGLVEQPGAASARAPPGSIAWHSISSQRLARRSVRAEQSWLIRLPAMPDPCDPRRRLLIDRRAREGWHSSSAALLPRIRRALISCLHGCYGRARKGRLPAAVDPSARRSRSRALALAPVPVASGVDEQHAGRAGQAHRPRPGARTQRPGDPQGAEKRRLGRQGCRRSPPEPGASGAHRLAGSSRRL